MFFRKIKFDDAEKGNTSAIFVGLCDYKTQLGLDLYNVTWCNRTDRDRDATSFHHGVLIGTAISGLLINCLVILYWLATWRRFKQTAHLFNINLVIIDVLDCMAVPMMVQNDFGNLNVSLEMCRALLLIHHGAFVARPLFLMFIWISRYNSLVINSITKSKSSVKWHQVLCTTVAWGVAGFSAVPSLMFANIGTVLSDGGWVNGSNETAAKVYERSRTYGTCGIPFMAFDRSYVSLQMTFVRILMWTLTPLCVLCVTNILIVKMLHQNKFKRKVKPMLILLAQMVSFLLTEMPFTVTVFSNLATPVERNCSVSIDKENAALVTHAFTVAHLSTNPLLYVILGVSVKTLYRELRTGQLWKTNKEARRLQASSCTRLDRLSGSTTPQASRSSRTNRGVGIVSETLVEDCVFTTTTPTTTASSSASVELFSHGHETSSTNTSLDGDSPESLILHHPYRPLGESRYVQPNLIYEENDISPRDKYLYDTDTDSDSTIHYRDSENSKVDLHRTYLGVYYTTGNRRRRRRSKSNTNFKTKRRNSKSELRKLANYLRPQTTAFSEIDVNSETNINTYPCVLLTTPHCRKRRHGQPTVSDEEESNAYQSVV
ncbi:envelope glycoprotein UL33 [Proboscivirus elephantidbeta5]|uniref:Envelope glycoprotein UL33 n=1 Tax=Elephant endotheliotropic herpesvirus 5 TaxID=768738 RepID=A0A075CZR0_9BETA|nr:envelope glycoprotein UL33 [Elephant endotheliotropic herpesvirus 5]AHC02784.1 envelope glycoprotein UL33 [Elephant endotheliotropic herpesvirus 5]